MKNKMKGLALLLALGLTCLAALTGCGGQSRGTDVTLGEDGSLIPAAEMARVQVWAYCDGDEATRNQMLTDAFNEKYKEYNISANFTQKPSSSYETTMKPTLSGENGPDVFLASDTYYKQWATLGLMENLDPYITHESEELNMEAQIADMFENSVGRYRYDVVTTTDDGPEAHYYGLPKGSGATAIYYNKDYLENAGVRIVSVYEEELDAFNAGGEDAAGNTKASLGITGTVKAVGYDPELKVFNNRISMNWEECATLAALIQNNAANKKAGCKYGFLTSWWFNYGFSVGGSCIGYVPTADAQYNGGYYTFTLADATVNYRVQEGKTLSVNGTEYQAGDIIKNLTAEGTVAGGAANVGGIVGYNYGTIENCTNKVVLSVHSTIEATNLYHYGGIAGYSEAGVIKGCTNLAVISLANVHTVGGIVGCASGDVLIENCTNGAENDEQAGAVAGSYEVGGIAGRLSTAGENGGSITGCTNYAPVTGSGKRIAGIVGIVVSNHALTGCNNYGAITSSQQSTSTGEGCVGGIAGGVYTVSITNCNNYASVTNAGSYYTGGILGWTDSDGVKVTGCTNTGAITGKRLVGGVVGELGQSGNKPNSVIENCTNSGEVRGSDVRIGGIAGMSYGGVVRNCTNTGTVYGSDGVAVTERIVGVSSSYTALIVGYNTSAAYCYVEGGYYKGTVFTDTSASA